MAARFLTNAPKFLSSAPQFLPGQFAQMPFSQGQMPFGQGQGQGQMPFAQGQGQIQGDESSGFTSWLTEPAVLYLILATGMCISYCGIETSRGKMTKTTTKAMVCLWVIISILATFIVFGTWHALMIGVRTPPVVVGFLIASFVTLSVSSSCVYWSYK